MGLVLKEGPREADARGLKNHEGDGLDDRVRGAQSVDGI
jgi:hypothetical protein